MVIDRSRVTTAHLFVRLQFRHLWRYRQVAAAPQPAPVSVIIAAKNEAANLRKNLPHLLGQRYPEFEVWVVDDHSDDDTPSVLAALDDPRLHVLSLPTDKHGKKAALQHAIQHARHACLVFTDADCWPASAHWLAKMVSGYRDATVVIGYSPVRKQHGLLNAWVRYETWLTGLLYLSAAAAGKPYMAVGRNWGYQKAGYESVGGFRHTKVLSGDDDLLLQQLVGKESVAVVVHPESWMWTVAPGSWRHWLRQKQRHLSTGWHYRPKDLWKLGAWTMSYAFHLAGVGVLLLIGQWPAALLAILIRATSQIAIFERSKDKLGEQGLRKWVVLLDSIYCLYIVIGIAILSLKRPSRWM